MKSNVILAALMATVSASKGDTTPVAGADAPAEPKNFWLHNGGHAGEFGLKNKDLGKIKINNNHAAFWMAPGGVDLQAFIVAELAKADRKWEKDEII